MMTSILRRLGLAAAFLAAGVAMSWAAGAETVAPPPNAPAAVAWNAAQGRLSLRYHGGVIFEATVRAEDAAGKAVAGVEAKLEQPAAAGGQEKIEQRLKFTLAQPQDGVKLVLSGVVTGSAEAFAAETAGEAQRRFPLVRNSVGLSRNLRNNALYDRHWDWVLVGPADGATRIAPKADKQQERTFDFQSTGNSIELTFRPRFYQKHRNLAYYDPWTYKACKGSGGPTSTISPRRRSTILRMCFPRRSSPTSAINISSWTTPIRSATAVVPRTG
ncbi:MAG: hypothetical protein NTV49_04615 [Kiritimatiellaeota bacterium]|nr:hypothetical protein [Kiritimatiellota bacterium]